jgi:hypothetical protein
MELTLFNLSFSFFLTALFIYLQSKLVSCHNNDFNIQSVYFKCFFSITSLSIYLFFREEIFLLISYLPMLDMGLINMFNPDDEKLKIGFLIHDTPSQAPQGPTVSGPSGGSTVGSGGSTAGSGGSTVGGPSGGSTVGGSGGPSGGSTVGGDDSTVGSGDSTVGGSSGSTIGGPSGGASGSSSGDPTLGGSDVGASTGIHHSGISHLELKQVGAKLKP